MVYLDMLQKNVHEWDDENAIEGIVAEDIEAGHAYGYFEHDAIVGYIAFDTRARAGSECVEWGCPYGEHLAVCRACVNPIRRQHSYAERLLAFAERSAREQGCSSVRVKAHISNKNARYILEECDYSFRGTVSHRLGLFCCYEKPLTAPEPPSPKGLAPSP